VSFIIIVPTKRPRAFSKRGARGGTSVYGGRKFDTGEETPNRDVPSFYNLWRGFAVEPRKGDMRRQQQRPSVLMKLKHVRSSTSS
jgi:hypothetical protein